MIWLLAGCSLVDITPPVVSARWVGGPEPTRDDVLLQVDVDDPHPGPVQVFLGDRLVGSSDGPGNVRVSEEHLPQGRSLLRVVAADATPWGLTTEAQVEVFLDTEAPNLAVPSTPAPAGQGQTLVVWVRADEPLVDPIVKAFDHDVPLYPVAESAEGVTYRTFVGVPLRTEPGPTHLFTSARDVAGNHGNVQVPVVVEAVDYPRGGRIRLSKAQVDARKDTEAKAAMRQARDAAYALLRPTATFDVPMERPVVGRTTSPFGVYRTYSDGHKSFHTGLDLANARGTPVTAAAAGEVVMAQEQAIFGNAVIVHHGHGVTTSYNHLNRIDVDVGDRVEAGDPIGLLGSTGQSTGPHLHFSMVVGEEAVDPSQWLDGDLDLTPATEWSAP